MEEKLPPEVLQEARELVFGYEELLRQAQASSAAELEKIDPKERGQYSHRPMSRMWELLRACQSRATRQVSLLQSAGFRGDM